MKKMYLSKWVLVEAINEWLKQRGDKTVLIEGKLLKSSEVEVRGINDQPFLSDIAVDVVIKS